MVELIDYRVVVYAYVLIIGIFLAICQFGRSHVKKE